MRLLDLFCGAGGAAMGYYHAGFTEIVGVDIEPQPHYPFTFAQADALTFPLEGFDVIHASPPCQGYSWTNYIYHCQKRSYARLLLQTRECLQGHAYVIENVPGAPLLSPVTLCGSHFGLPLRRHRLFESSSSLRSGFTCSHKQPEFGVYANKVTRVGTRGVSYVAGSGRTHYRPKTATLADGQEAMGINWMSIQELSQAVPPAYTEWIGRQLLQSVARNL